MSLIFDFLGVGQLIGSFLPNNQAGTIVNDILNPVGFIVGASMGTNQLKENTDWSKWIGQGIEVVLIGVVGIGIIRAVT